MLFLVLVCSTACSLALPGSILFCWGPHPSNYSGSSERLSQVRQKPVSWAISKTWEIRCSFHSFLSLPKEKPGVVIFLPFASSCAVLWEGLSITVEMKGFSYSFQRGLSWLWAGLGHCNLTGFWNSHIGFGTVYFC